MFKDNPYHPPFAPGDLVESITDDHTTARRGRRFEVLSTYPTSKGWRIKVRHPYSRFNPSSYYARKFRLVTELEQEKSSMYIALDAKQVDLSALCPSNIREATFVAMDTTMDRGLRNDVEHYLKQNPEARVLVFSLDKIVEVDAPPVLWRNMR